MYHQPQLPLTNQIVRWALGNRPNSTTLLSAFAAAFRNHLSQPLTFTLDSVHPASEIWTLKYKKEKKQDFETKLRSSLGD
jgi:hypothetical protein